MDKLIYALPCVFVVLGLLLWLLRRHLFSPREQKIKNGYEPVRADSSEPDELGARTENQQSDNVGDSTAQVYSKDEQIFRRVFLDKANKCSEGDVVDLCAELNGRIDSLVLNVQDKWDKVKDEARERDVHSIALGVSPSVALGSDVLLGKTTVTKLVRTALGSEIHKAVTNLTTKDPVFDAVVQDALQAWITFCVYSAIKPLLFGLQSRTQKDVEEAICEMENHEPEIAKIWKKLREENTPATRYRFCYFVRCILHFVRYIFRFVRCIFRLSKTTLEDSDGFRLLEETYHQMLFDKRSPTIALHWRALLHAYDRKRDSFSVALKQTQEVLCKGLLEVFVLAGGNPPDSFLDSIRVLTAKNRIIEEASRVAESVVTGCFWANLEVFVVDPGGLYDSELMVLDGQARTTDAATIKCTVGLGLREIVPEAAGFKKETKRVLLKAKVKSSVLPTAKTGVFAVATFRLLGHWRFFTGAST
ncbi:hypothetical protein DFH11DRAFT_1740941 [Phellopilus nigrolimitatus]|nr:hypothetical protein DFH11DRAFT_1740941 [Phellopilus nigrolimitatus]